jgi:GTP-binding protein EngB required for normal cell division
MFGADGENQLVLCDMKGLKNVTKEGDEFAAYLANDQRSILHGGFELATGRAAPAPDVVFLVFDGEKLSSMTDEEAEKLLEPYAGFMGKVRAALKKPRLPFLIVVTKMDKVQAADTEATRQQVVRCISAALPDDELDVHFVRNYTRKELEVNRKVVAEGGTGEASAGCGVVGWRAPF